MNTGPLVDGLLLFLAFVAFVAFHEYAHAWTAERCGDDTPRLQGRLTLNPIVHADLFGTIILPLALVLIGVAAGQQNPLFFGWGKPVQVNLNNFRVRRRDDILVSAAGPAMNLVLAIALLCVMKIVDLAGGDMHLINNILPLARLSLLLCIFNLLPIPPLDGGHIIRNLLGISDEMYMSISRFSFMFFLLIMQSPAVGQFISLTTESLLEILARPFGWHMVSL
jgi:Zn-dependent protease